MARTFALEVHVTHFPLHPDTPAEGLTLEQLFGARVDVGRMNAEMAARMNAEGLPWGERTRTYNSRLAQELGAWAVDRGGAAIHDALFRAYFVEGRNLGDREVLVEVARQVGLPGDEARNALEKRTHRDAVDADWERSRRLGVTGVPTFRYRDRVVVGAQPYEVLERFVRSAGE